VALGRLAGDDAVGLGQLEVGEEAVAGGCRQTHLLRGFRVVEEG